jgi:hypothetical protein
VIHFVLEILIACMIIVTILSGAPSHSDLLLGILKLVEHLLILLAANNLLALSLLYLTDLTIDSHALIVPSSVLLDSNHIVFIINQYNWSFTYNALFSRQVEVIPYSI